MSLFFVFTHTFYTHVFKAQHLAHSFWHPNHLSADDACIMWQLTLILLLQVNVGFVHSLQHVESIGIGKTLYKGATSLSKPQENNFSVLCINQPKVETCCFLCTHFMHKFLLTNFYALQYWQGLPYNIPIETHRTHL